VAILLDGAVFSVVEFDTGGGFQLFRRFGARCDLASCGHFVQREGGIFRRGVLAHDSTPVLSKSTSMGRLLGCSDWISLVSVGVLPPALQCPFQHFVQREGEIFRRGVLVHDSTPGRKGILLSFLFLCFDTRGGVLSILLSSFCHCPF
jgi:hypothetical protein